MEPLEAAVTILREEAEPLHWTRIQDLALRRGLLDPFATPDIRKAILGALASGTRQGVLEKVATGVYRLLDQDTGEPPGD